MFASCPQHQYKNSNIQTGLYRSPEEVCSKEMAQTGRRCDHQRSHTGVRLNEKVLVTGAH